jgi:phage tail tube protein FII
MSDSRNIVLVRALVNGLPVMAGLESFSPPMVEKTTEDDKGGRFVSIKSVTGVTLGDWTLTLTNGAAEFIRAMGEGENAEITVLLSVKGDDGIKTQIKHEMSGEVLKAETGDIKVGKDSLTITGSPFAYTYTEGGSIVHDINGRTQKCVVGGKDLLTVARGHVDL